MGRRALPQDHHGGRQSDPENEKIHLCFLNLNRGTSRFGSKAVLTLFIYLVTTKIFLAFVTSLFVRLSSSDEIYAALMLLAAL